MQDVVPENNQNTTYREENYGAAYTKAPLYNTQTLDKEG